MEYTAKLESTEATKTFGEKVGRLLIGGECFVLIGDVGAGKTTFTKGLARGLGIAESIQSPTFTINRVYEARDGLQLSHYDFYRLSDAGIMADELAEAQQNGRTIIIIEWADVVKDVLPESRIELQISSPSVDTRIVTMTAYGKQHAQIISGLSE